MILGTEPRHRPCVEIVERGGDPDAADAADAGEPGPAAS
jgi:hypothetical protein